MISSTHAKTILKHLALRLRVIDLSGGLGLKLRKTMETILRLVMMSAISKITSFGCLRKYTKYGRKLSTLDCVFEKFRFRKAFTVPYHRLSRA